MIYEQAFCVDSRDADLWGQCRPSALLGYLQEAATEAAVLSGGTRETMLERYRCFWMLARIRVEQTRPLCWGEELTVQTWHREPKGASIYRDFEWFSGGERVGEAVSTWVLADADTRKLVRMSRLEGMLEDNRGGEREKTEPLTRLRLPEELTVAEERLTRYSETDINGHINNTRYADYLCDCLHPERRKSGSFVRQMQIGFLAECRPGERLTLFRAEAGQEQFVRGVGGDGTARFEGSVVWG